MPVPTDSWSTREHHAQPDQLEAAEKALRWVFPDLKFTSTQITPDAAAYSFRVLRKVNIGSRAALALFKLTQLPLNVRSWSDIPKEVFDAAKEAVKDPQKSMKSRIAIALIALQHQRLMQWHLKDPDTHPCPGLLGPVAVVMP